MNPIQKNWINFKIPFCTAHRELKETGESKMQDAGFHQANLVNEFVSNLAALQFPYPPTGTQEPIYSPTPTLIPTAAPMLAPISQTAPAANADTDAASTIIPELLTKMQKMQQLMVHMKSNQGGGGGLNSYCNNRHPLTSQATTEPRQGKTQRLLPDFFTKYCCTHIKCARKGAECNNKAPRHQDTATFFNKHNDNTYRCTCRTRYLGRSKIQN